MVQTARHVMVYDAGQQYNQESDAGSKTVVPYLRIQGIQQLDAMVISHDDSDHSGGAASVLSQIPIKWLASSYALPATTMTMPKQLKCYAGQKWMWDRVSFEVLHPSVDSYQDAGIKDNNRSCVIKVTSQNGTILLTGDIEKDAERALLKTQRYKLVSDVLVAPHHGSQTSSTEPFIKAVGAKHIIFTVGYLNRFKHPKPAVVNRFLATDSTLYRSDHHGAITLEFVRNCVLKANAE